MQFSFSLRFSEKVLKVLKQTHAYSFLFDKFFSQVNNNYFFHHPTSLMHIYLIVVTINSMLIFQLELMLGEWRQAMGRRVLKVNLEKTKMMVTEREMDDVLQVWRYPCGVCSHGVANSVLCRTCESGVILLLKRKKKSAVQS